MNRATDINASIEALEVGSISGALGKAVTMLGILDSLRWETLQLESEDMGAGGRAAKREAALKITEAYEAMGRVITNLQHRPYMRRKSKN